MRSRNIKPGFFKNEYLASLSPLHRILFAGLWCCADREGRLQDRPLRIKAEVLPYDNCDANSMLEDLQQAEFIVRYKIDGSSFIQIANFTVHQQPHHKEVGSTIPAPKGFDQITKHPYDVPEDIRVFVMERDGKCLCCGSKEDLSIDHVVPLSLGGDNSPENLQTLCKKCNSGKGTSIKDYRKPFVESTLAQRKVKQDASCPSDSLIPDSLIPDSKTFTPLTGSVADPASRIPPCPSKEIQEAWNMILNPAGCHRVDSIQGTRRKHLQARWKENSEMQSIRAWEALFGYIRDSCPFLVGREHSRDKPPFFITMDWLVSPTNFTKIREGHYEQRRKGVTVNG